MADPLLDRDIKITYGSLVIGGVASGTNYHPYGKFQIDMTYPTGRFVQQVLVAGATDAELATREDALVDAFRTPDQRLLIEQGASTRFDFNPATNTGFNQLPRAQKVGNVEDKARCVLYEVSVDFTLPADFSGGVSGDAGLLESAISVSLDGSNRKTLQISGSYTALSSNAARAQYEAQIDLYATAIQTLVDSTAVWKQEETPETVHDKNNKVLRFSRTYTELVVGTFVAVLNKDEYRKQTLNISVDDTAATLGAGANGARNPTTISVSYSVSIDIDTTLNLENEWKNTIRPHLLAQITAAAGSYVLVQDRVTYGADGNTLFANLVARSYSGVSLLELRVTTEDDRDFGRTLVPLADGKAFSYRSYQGPEIWIRRITRTGIRVAAAVQSTGVSRRIGGGAGGAGLIQPIDTGIFGIGRRAQLVFLPPPGAAPASGALQGPQPLSDIETPEGFIPTGEGNVSSEFVDGLPGTTQPLEAFTETVVYQKATVT